jgi:hypothetical protein
MSTYDDASLIMFPSGYKEDKIYSLKPTDGSGDLTFTRASTATRVNAEGLVEGVRTNLALYSEEFDNAYWTKLGATITANAATSPDGTQNADKLVEDVGSVQPSFYRTNIANSNTTYTKSIYAKAGERIWLVMNIGNGIDSARAWFNLSTGVVGTVNAGLTAQIQDAGNGWYRCTITREIVAFASSVIEFQIATSDGVEGYTGNGTSGLFIYGCQFEQSPSATEYIPTTTTAVSVGMLANVPRIDYTGGGCGKLLLEPQRTNLFINSEQFDNAYWSKAVIAESYAGNGTSGVFLWGAQFEAGSYVSSYVPTLASSVTRLADAASKTGISSLIGQTEGVIFIDFEIQTTNEEMVVMNIYNGSNGIYFYLNSSNELVGRGV